jgi:hypothetical protein
MVLSEHTLRSALPGVPPLGFPGFILPHGEKLGGGPDWLEVTDWLLLDPLGLRVAGNRLVATAPHIFGLPIVWIK